MNTYDLTPLLRTTVGFDRINRIFDTVLREPANAPSYPPYNIEALEDNAYRITMAVAGFGEGDIEVTQKENALVVSGRMAGPDGKDADGKDRVFLHRGIAARAFERRFVLADHVSVTAANLANGLLNIELVRELPEALKPRTIAIETPAGVKRLTRKKAA